MGLATTVAGSGYEDHISQGLEFKHSLNQDQEDQLEECDLPTATELRQDMLEKPSPGFGSDDRGKIVEETR